MIQFANFNWIYIHMDNQLWPKKRSCFSITPMSQVVMWQCEEEKIPLQQPNHRQATWHMLSSDLLGCLPKPLHCKPIQTPWPHEESKPAQMWLDSRRGHQRYQTQSQSLGILMRFWNQGCSHCPNTWMTNTAFSIWIFIFSKEFIIPLPNEVGEGYAGFTLSVHPSVYPSICRWHGFQSVSQVCFGILISNSMCMLIVAMGRSLLIFSDLTTKMATWRPYWIIFCFWTL